jgi:protein-S-isoprenylcysteine O-methyltransferase Ste14
MRSLVGVWPYALVFWLVFVWVYFTEFLLTARTGSKAGKQDAGTLPVVVVMQFVAMAAAFVIAFGSRFWGVSHPRSWFWTGIAVMVAGSLLRRHCFRMLGSSFTAAVVVVQGQAIVERGAYRWIRHPSYSGGLLIYAGIGSALGNWISLAEIVGVVLASYLFRVRAEETALVETLGKPYRDYMRRTKRFVPLVI